MKKESTVILFTGVWLLGGMATIEAIPAPTSPTVVRRRKIVVNGK